jgi:epoxyqueuosine reductase QueG
LGKKLIPSVLDDIIDHPTPLYFHHYRQINFFLDRAALILDDYIRDLGAQALPIPASQVIDWERQKAHLSHKKIGELAGLGWLGRNNLLINPEVGAQFRLVTILTDLPLKSDVPLSRDCASCYLCLSVCPVRAIKESQAEFDHWACFEQLKEFRRKGYVGQYICGICVKACSGPK